MRTMHWAIAVAATLAAGAAVAQEQEVNVYNGRHYGTDVQLWEGFTKATGITVNVIDGNADQLVQRIKSEGAQSPADLLITVDAGRLAFAASAGILQPIRSAALEGAIPAELREPDGLWYGLAKRARVIVHAKDRFDPALAPTYEALAEPALKGKVLVRSSTNIYNLSLVGSLLVANGYDQTLNWCEGFVANLARPPEGGDTDQLKAVAAGVGDVAVSNTYYLARLAASSKPEDQEVANQLAVIFPNQDGRGTHVNISGAAVVRTAPHKDNAVRLMEWLAQPEQQRYFADVSFEYPANPAVTPHPVLAGWGQFKGDALNASLYAKEGAQAAALTDECGWR